jgi:hypothetical protein
MAGSLAPAEGHAYVRLANSGARRLYAGLGAATTSAITQRVRRASSLPTKQVQLAPFGSHTPHKAPVAGGGAADPAERPTAAAERPSDAAERPSDALRKPTPGPLYPWVKRASYIELALFAALLLFWLLPGFEGETFVFGLSHGIGFIALCLLIWIAVLRREAPYTLLAATLTPAGPVGSVIAIEWMERRPPHAEGSKAE